MSDETFYARSRRDGAGEVCHRMLPPDRQVIAVCANLADAKDVAGLMNQGNRYPRMVEDAKGLDFVRLERLVERIGRWAARTDETDPLLQDGVQDLDAALDSDDAATMESEWARVFITLARRAWTQRLDTENAVLRRFAVEKARTAGPTESVTACPRCGCPGKDQLGDYCSGEWATCPMVEFADFGEGLRFLQDELNPEQEGS